MLMEPGFFAGGRALHASGRPRLDAVTSDWLPPEAVSSDWATVRLAYVRSVGPRERLARWLGWDRREAA